MSLTSQPYTDCMLHTLRGYRSATHTHVLQQTDQVGLCCNPVTTPHSMSHKASLQHTPHNMQLKVAHWIESDLQATANHRLPTAHQVAIVMATSPMGNTGPLSHAAETQAVSACFADRGDTLQTAGTTAYSPLLHKHA